MFTSLFTGHFGVPTNLVWLTKLLADRVGRNYIPIPKAPDGYLRLRTAEARHSSEQHDMRKELSITTTCKFKKKDGRHTYLDT